MASPLPHSALHATRRAVVCLVLPLLLLATGAVADAENLMFQRNFAAGSMKQDPADLVSMISSLSEQVKEMKDMMTAMQRSMEEKLSDCCTGCKAPPEKSTPSLKPPGARAGDLPGLCATFGDPHFTTFDGAHTILLRDMPMWLVKSEQVWVQGLAKTTWGNLMGVAVGGPFMQNHSLVVYNSTLDEGKSPGFTVLFDGEPILASPDADGNAEFESPFLLWAARRTEWTPSLHDRTILEMDSAINWDVGSWSERFSEKPEGGIYVFKFPWGVELTVTGVDFMSAVVRMYKTGEQSGYCGNFDGMADDEFLPPDEGSVPPNLVAAWGKPVGEDLDPVADTDDLFLRAQGPAQLVRMVLQDGVPPPMARPLIEDCSEELMAEAQAQCSKAGPIDDLIMWQSCVIDYCLQKNPTVVQDMAAAEGLQKGWTAKGEVAYLGHGQCEDEQGRHFRVLRTESLRNINNCTRFLRSMVNITGVLGAQLQVESTCEIVVTPTFDFAAATLPAPPVGDWASPTVVDPEGEVGTTFVSGVGQNPQSGKAWSCWRLN